MVKTDICFLFLLFIFCLNVHKSEAETSFHPISSTKDGLKGKEDTTVNNGRRVIEISSFGDTCQYSVDVNNRFLYTDGDIYNLDIEDTIYYSYKNNRVTGFRYASGIRPTEEDSLRLMDEITFEEDLCDYLNRLGVKFFSLNINSCEIRDVSTVLMDNKYSKKKDSDGSLSFTVSQPQPYGRKTFSSYIDGYIDGDSYLTRYELKTNSKGWIQEEIYTFSNVVVTRKYHYSKREMDMQIYQDGEKFYESKYYINFDLTLE